MQTPISDRGLIVGFLMLWLKRCVIPSLPHDAIAIEVVYSVILLAHGKPLGLLLAIVCKIQSDFWKLGTEFCPGS